MGRPSIYGRPMTVAERKTRSRGMLAANVYAEILIAIDELETGRRAAARLIGGTSTDEHLLRAMDALERLRDMNHP